ncbi:BTAD domain-containing putative transcriptional regulator [Euzebya rosea]|uniref:BTAD domain-containing putative transcriptional regulator n=1 Tax=Euzebya rosea TaxID=2052804 RepID=UPI000D3E6DD0|nr:BTAD domain-containing putative transcriptional regulator [Euzebya rosea]
MALVEIRLLGTFRVRRTDGTYVAASDWRTMMTRSLLALVALRAPHPVPVDVALEAIWPGVDPGRSRARLRTAASQVRKAVGSNCLQREGDTLVLREAWVDAGAFEASVARVRRRYMMEDAESGLALAQSALATFAGDISDDWPGADWIDEQRRHLHQLHLSLLVESAEAAISIGAWRLAQMLSDRAAGIDPCSERACRALMESSAHLGETGRALRAYESCRNALVDTLGADPSERTDALHLGLLRKVAARPAVPFVGRQVLRQHLQQRIGSAFRARHAILVHLVGEPGVGKSRLLDEIAQYTDGVATLVRLDSVQGLAPGSAHERILRPIVGQDGRITVSEPTLLCVDDAQWADTQSLTLLADELADLSVPLAVVTAGAARDDVTGRGDVVGVDPLRRDEAARLIDLVLERTADPDVRQGLLDRSGGIPALLIDECVRHQLVGESEDVDPPSSVAPEGRPEEIVERARERLTPSELEVLEVLAVLGTPADAPGLRHLVPDTDAVESTLDVLEDCGVLQRNEGSWSFADEDTRLAAYRWLRPSVRRQLHRRIARCTAFPTSRTARLGHWVEAGAPVRSMDVSRPDVVSLKDGPSGMLPVPTELQVLTEGARASDRLAGIAAVLEASDGVEEDVMVRALDAAIAMASTDAPDLLPRLYRRRAALQAPGDDPYGWYELARSAVPDNDVVERCHVEMTGARILARWSVPRATEAASAAVVLADRAADPMLQVRSRSHLGVQYLATRRIKDASRAGRTAAAIAERTGSRALMVQALLGVASPRLWVGQAPEAMETLERAWTMSVEYPRLNGIAAGWFARALHEVGADDVDRALTVSARAADRAPRSPHHAIEAEILLERGDPAAALGRLETATAVSGRAPAMQFVWLNLLLARAHAALGDHEHASEMVQQSILVSSHSGATLLLAEAYARLAALQAPSDPDAANRSLGRAVAASGGRPFPREQTVMLLCHAEVLDALGRPGGAIGFAEAARSIAAREGLRIREAEAEAFLRRHRGTNRTPASVA